MFMASELNKGLMRRENYCILARILSYYSENGVGKFSVIIVVTGRDRIG